MTGLKLLVDHVPVSRGVQRSVQIQFLFPAEPDHSDVGRNVRVLDRSLHRLGLHTVVRFEPDHIAPCAHQQVGLIVSSTFIALVSDQGDRGEGAKLNAEILTKERNQYIVIPLESPMPLCDAGAPLVIPVQVEAHQVRLTNKACEHAIGRVPHVNQLLQLMAGLSPQVCHGGLQAGGHEIVRAVKNLSGTFLLQSSFPR